MPKCNNTVNMTTVTRHNKVLKTQLKMKVVLSRGQRNFTSVGVGALMVVCLIPCGTSCTPQWQKGTMAEFHFGHEDGILGKSTKWGVQLVSNHSVAGLWISGTPKKSNKRSSSQDSIQQQ